MVSTSDGWGPCVIVNIKNVKHVLAFLDKEKRGEKKVKRATEGEEDTPHWSSGETVSESGEPNRGTKFHIREAVSATPYNSPFFSA